MEIEEIKWQGGKLFSEEGCTLPLRSDVLVLVGKNNSGKSRIIEFLINLGQKQVEPDTFEITIKGETFADYLENEKSKYQFGAFDDVIRDLKGKHFTFGATQRRKIDPTEFTFPDLFKYYADRAAKSKFGILEQYLLMKWNIFTERSIEAIGSERNVVPELRHPYFTLDNHGAGVTRELSSIYLDDNKDDKLLSHNIRNFINGVLGDDEAVEEICTKVISRTEDLYEVNFRMAEKGLVPISKSGSSLKSLLLIGLKLFILSERDSYGQQKILFIEEPENNIHAYALRRLLSNLQILCRENKIKLILTTHSNITIDFFASDPSASIVQVSHDGKHITAKPISHLGEVVSIVQALGCKPSDVMQANGVVWVEGPSDRIYLKKWIDLVSEGHLIEGRHYQIAFYGGALFYHLDADDKPEDESLVNLLNINRNAFFICDADKDSEKAPLKEPVKRITEKLQGSTRFGSWVTSFYEIEGYIPPSILAEYTRGKQEPREIGNFEPFFQDEKDGHVSYWEEITTRKSFQKTKWALQFTEKMTLENMKHQGDWKKKMEELKTVIEGWNT